MKEKGNLIVLEGARDVGKTTLSHRLAESIVERGLSCRVIAFPGNASGTLGNLVKRVHEDPVSFDIQNIDPASLQLLHVAAHIDAIENRIRPLLDEGTIVVLDRFWWSTLVYGRIAGVDEEVLNEMIDLEKQCWDGILPEKVCLIDRDAPLNSNIDLNSWNQVRSEYLSFAESNEHGYPVEVVSNTASVKDTVKHLKSSVDKVLSGVPRSTR